MITVNISNKDAREFLEFLYAVNPACSSVAKAVMSQIERQMMPVSTNQAELAIWRGKRMIPNLIELWKRKNETAEKCFGENLQMFREATPAEELKGRMASALMYSTKTGSEVYNMLVNGRSGRW